MGITTSSSRRGPAAPLGAVGHQDTIRSLATALGRHDPRVFDPAKAVKHVAHLLWGSGAEYRGPRDAVPKYTVVVQTWAGIAQAVLRGLLCPRCTIADVRRAFLGQRLAVHLRRHKVKVPPDFIGRFTQLLREAAHTCGRPKVMLPLGLAEIIGSTDPSAVENLQRAIDSATTDFEDVVAIQLAQLPEGDATTPEPTILAPNRSLNTLGLTSPSKPLRLTVTIREDRAAFDAFRGKVLAGHPVDGAELAAVTNALTNRDNVLSKPLDYGTLPCWLDDLGVVLERVSGAGWELALASDRLRANPEVVCAAIKNAGGAVRYASPELRGDRSIVLAAMKNLDAWPRSGRRELLPGIVPLNNSNVLKCVPPVLRADRAVVLTAVANVGGALKHAPPELRADRAVVLTAVANAGNALEHASPELRADCKVVLAAVTRTGNALKHASEGPRGSRAVVLAAVSANGCALKYASEELRGDLKVALVAAHNSLNADALKHASEELRGNREAMLAAVRINGGALKHASEELRGDRGVVLAAVAQSGAALEHAPHRLRGDREVVLTAVTGCGYALRFASQEMRGDRGVVLAAVAQYGNAMYSASQELQEDPKVIFAAERSRQPRKRNRSESDGQRGRAGVDRTPPGPRFFSPRAGATASAGRGCRGRGAGW
jgi:hypothetical protein